MKDEMNKFGPDTLTPDETRSILDGLDRMKGEFRDPVVVVDREQPGRCEVYEREDVARSFSADPEHRDRLMALLAPAQYPFVRVLLLSPTAATSIRICRSFTGPGAVGIS